VRTDDLDYDLPQSAIAQTPAEPRDSARLLVDMGPEGHPLDATVAGLAELVRPDDVVVLNDTRVLPARVEIARPGGGAGEVLLLEEESDGWWQALCRPSRKLNPGTVVTSRAGGLDLEIGEVLDAGRRLVRPLHTGSLIEALERSGTVPLPPYINGSLEDADRYQTVFARRPASAAAPTAGLHLTAELLDRIEQRGARIARVELMIGLDTFRPIDTARVEDHDIHSERYRVPAETLAAIETAKGRGGRVVAIGTTTVRALEAEATSGVAEGRTRLFITPGYRFCAVDVLMTNFHLPRSSLLALIEAFVGPRWRELYATALERRYRFLSFGDAMLLQRQSPESSSREEGS
jgi:S-adenosylmethionine:tRNA ribosyltransferase-isomerase